MATIKQKFDRLVFVTLDLLIQKLFLWTLLVLYLEPSKIIRVPPYDEKIMKKLLADPGEARGCSTNTSL